MIDPDMHIVLCNGAKLPAGIKSKSLLVLKYFGRKPEVNVKLKLNDFVTSVYHLDKRTKDLLEIVGYVFAADRKKSRGAINSVEYQKWSRKFHFIIKVRDFKFWNQRKVKKALSDALTFMSGDQEYIFTFIDGEKDFPANLFDNEKFIIEKEKNVRVVLFSGGLDSLAGIVELLETTDDHLCLISHQSGQPGIKKTQSILINKLNLLYGYRCSHFKFRCGLTGPHAAEETQRTRSLLYCAMAYAIAQAHSKNDFYVFENGITSINFAKRQDLINARASRTTHPKSLALLQNLFKMVSGHSVEIKHPYLFKTKKDIVETLKLYHREDLIDSSVSCIKSFQNTTQFTHCGECSQCIDRRFAMYAASVDSFDENGIYQMDFLRNPIELGTTKTSLVDYIRLAKTFEQSSIDSFYLNFLDELTDLEEYIDGVEEEDRIEKIFNLCKSHSVNTSTALDKMRQKFDSVFDRLPEKSFFKLIVDAREYLKPEPIRFSESLVSRLRNSVPIAFSSEKPKREDALNDHINSILSADKEQYEREFPVIKFAMAKVVPDHSYIDVNLFIEGKYVRGTNSPSVASSGIAEDLTKYPKDKFKLFIVYDPEHQIIDEQKFCKDFEANDNCKIVIIR